MTTIIKKIKARANLGLAFHGAFWGGILLSLFSLSDMCTGGCSAVSDYRIFGTRFAYMGVFYFSLLAGSFAIASYAREKRYYVFDALVLAGVGAEIYFVIIQKFGVHQWCPICLSICAVVVLIAVMRGYELNRDRLRQKAASGLVEEVDKGKAKPVLRFAGVALICLLTVISGFAVAVAGVKKTPVALSSQAKRLLSGMAPDSLLNPLEHADIWIGKADSPIDVYLVADWYCGYCKKIQPDIEKSLPDVASKARYTWLDMPVHMASLNVVPVSVSLLLNSRQDVQKGRKILDGLTSKKQSVTDVEAIEALKEAGIAFMPAKEGEVRRLVAETVNFCKIHDISMTPSAVIINRSTGVTKVLRGADDVSGVKIVAAIAMLQSADTAVK
ncbi:thioredoxin domain-containing protein (plasmid) [Trichlorobacter lovleyi]|uniref:vitamin K epoxide reductase family protein n=1 Tax=Trichlorobacter lovleyi TaxID=313985 RepID=UPI002240B9B5|nr:thioredoxin domain-containing protein [Trichlorobacter lovleyi]QOX80934.1 thioredoxin domain-containing protein [Trichlorobacter lovleyi]